MLEEIIAREQDIAARIAHARTEGQENIAATRKNAEEDLEALKKKLDADLAQALAEAKRAAEQEANTLVQAAASETASPLLTEQEAAAIAQDVLAAHIHIKRGHH
jgi:vacuolar-type H+-ATPase subunit H